jgi:hypothetical protein
VAEKLEYRNPKSETNPNDPKFKIQNGSQADPSSASLPYLWRTAAWRVNPADYRLAKWF